MGRLAYALATLPLLMQLVQTRIRLAAPLTRAWTACRFGFQRRRVTLWAWEMLLPNCGPLPQTSHTCAIAKLQNPSRVVPGFTSVLGWAASVDLASLAPERS